MDTPKHIGDLKPDPRNARKHNPRNIGMIVDSLHEVGAGRSIVIDGDNQIICGNGTVDAAAEAGIEDIIVVDTDGSKLVVVRRSDLTDEQKTRMALFDNQTAATAEWDAVVMAEMVAEGVKLDDLFYDNELNRILGKVDDGVNDPLDEWKGMPECDNEDVGAWRTLKVHFKSEEDLETFCQLVGQKVTDKTKYIWFPEDDLSQYADKAFKDESE